MNLLSGRLGVRFLFVTLIPHGVFIAYVGALVAAGAPTSRPDLQHAADAFSGLSGRGLLAAGAAVLVVSIVAHPLQYPLVQLLEGYWYALPMGPALAEARVARMREQHRTLRAGALVVPAPGDWAAAQAAAESQQRLVWLPDEETALLPTTLGNVLRAGEARAGSRYKLDIAIALPRLFPVMSVAVLAQVNDRRNQLDACVRLCLVGLAATAVSVGLLFRFDVWMFLPVATFAGAWACYQAAVAAARGYCLDLAAAVDLHHLDMVAALSLERPGNMQEARTQYEELCDRLRGTDELMADEWASVKYRKEPPPGRAPD